MYSSAEQIPQRATLPPCRDVCSLINDSHSLATPYVNCQTGCHAMARNEHDLTWADSLGIFEEGMAS